MGARGCLNWLDAQLMPHELGYLWIINHKGWCDMWHDFMKALFTLVVIMIVLLVIFPKEK